MTMKFRPIYENRKWRVCRPNKRTWKYNFIQVELLSIFPYSVARLVIWVSVSQFQLTMRQPVARKVDLRTGEVFVLKMTALYSFNQRSSGCTSFRGMTNMCPAALFCLSFQVSNGVGNNICRGGGGMKHPFSSQTNTTTFCGDSSGPLKVSRSASRWWITWKSGKLIRSCVSFHTLCLLLHPVCTHLSARGPQAGLQIQCVHTGKVLLICLVTIWCYLTLK